MIRVSSPVVFVHGSNTDARIWDAHRDIIEPRYRLIAPTQRYFGALPWPDDGRDFSIPTHAVDLAAFIQTSNVAPATIVGWSYGGAVSLAMALQHPELVERLFLYEPALATFVGDASDAKNASADRVEMTRAAKAEADAANFDRAVRLFMDGVNDEAGTFGRLPPAVQQIMLENSRMLSLLFAARPPQITCADLSSVKIPVTVAIGEDSRAFYRIAAQWAARCIPNAQLKTIPNARHLLPVQNAREFSQVVVDFLDARP